MSDWKDPKSFASWQEAAVNGQLLSYLGHTLPDTLEDIAGPRQPNSLLGQLGAPDWLQDAARYASIPAKLAVEPLVQAAKGTQAMLAGDDSPEARKDLTGALLGMGVSGLRYGDAPRGSLGVFAGQEARNADLGALALARQAEAQGLPNKQIWENTGWFKDVDGHWKWEIPDSSAAFKMKI